MDMPLQHAHPDVLCAMSATSTVSLLHLEILDDFSYARARALRCARRSSSAFRRNRSSVAYLKQRSAGRSIALDSSNTVPRKARGAGSREVLVRQAPQAFDLLARSAAVDPSARWRTSGGGMARTSVNDAVYVPEAAARSAGNQAAVRLDEGQVPGVDGGATSKVEAAELLVVPSRSKDAVCSISSATDRRSSRRLKKICCPPETPSGGASPRIRSALHAAFARARLRLRRRRLRDLRAARTR